MTNDPYDKKFRYQNKLLSQPSKLATTTKGKEIHIRKYLNANYMIIP